MASVEKVRTASGDVRYRVRWWADDRRVEKWVRTAEEARTLKNRLEADVLDGLAVDPRAGAQILNEYFDSWLPVRLVRGRPLTPATRLGYERVWRRTIRETLGKKRLRSIRPETVRSWHAEVVERAGRDQAAKAYRVLRAVLNTAVADDLIRANPCRIRGAGQEHTAERPLVETELVLALADAIDRRFRAFVLLAGFGGLRTGESLGLRRRDVDLLHGEVHVLVQAQEVTGVGRVLLDPKTDAGKRVVALPSVVVAALEEHLATYTDADLEAPVFTGEKGRPVRRDMVSDAWRAACVATNAPDGLRPHDLRHHAATLTARMPGITTKELMARIGHASPRAALIYQHATTERDRAIAAYLDDVIAVASGERPHRQPPASPPSARIRRRSG